MALKVVIRKLDEGSRLNNIEVPIAAATDVEAGNLISIKSGKAVTMVDNKDCDTFAGIALATSPVGEKINVTVCTNCVVEAPVESATYEIGDEVALKADATVLEKSAADTIGWVIESSNGATVTKAKIRINTFGLNKFFKVNATSA
jgi:hypothetical protein